MSRNKIAMKKTRLFVGSALVTAVSLAVAPSVARAQPSVSVPLQGAMAVTATVNPNTPGTVIYCALPAPPGPPQTSSLELVAEAHGNGFTSLGAFTFAFNKFVSLPGAMQGCATLTAPNGDYLIAAYQGTAGTGDSNGFTPATGTLTITGGTGRFQGASGKVDFSALFLALYPGSSFAGGPPKPLLYVSAFYTLEGTLSLPFGPGH